MNNSKTTEVILTIIMEIDGAKLSNDLNTRLFELIPDVDQDLLIAICTELGEYDGGADYHAVAMLVKGRVPDMDEDALIALIKRVDVAQTQVVLEFLMMEDEDEDEDK